MPPSQALEPGATGNLFLDSLPARSTAALLAKCQRLDVLRDMPVAEQGAPFKHVMFPIDCAISAVTRMNDGTDVEVILIGREGLYGFQLALGNGTASQAAMVQIPGSTFQMASADFDVALAADADLNATVLKYALANLDAIAQFSGCNRLHPINERLARWLLMAHDRVADDELLLTHEYLATMLGVRRPAVSLAAYALDRAGVIEYSRGQIRIANRSGLETASCECYGVANDAIERLLGYSVRKSAGPLGSTAN